MEHVPTDSGLIEAHGGQLVERILAASEMEQFEQRHSDSQKLQLNADQESDLEMITTGGYSPLKGFMTEAQYRGVIEKMQLPGAILWPIPIVLSVTPERAKAFQKGELIGLTNQSGELIGELKLEDKYQIDRHEFAREVFGTTDEAHPGVKKTLEQDEICIGGAVRATALLCSDKRFKQYRLTPAQTRSYFARQNWRRVVGFQTRNPIHRAHEYLLKSALEIVDGLLLHPLVGQTKQGDVPAAVRMSCYEEILQNYFPADRVLLSVMPAKMNYAGPKEAILHAIIRQNYGCTHFIVGRDHAGVGDYYGTYEAQEIFDDLPEGSLKIQPLFFEYAFWCKICGNIASNKTCPHDAENHLFLSGTKVREMLAEGEDLPVEFSRPEVAKTLKQAYSERG